MANRRMFSLSIIDTDLFIEMPVTSRLLYYELGMRADDDGFVGNWKKILRTANLSEDDMKILIAKKFIIPFESGVIVIRHWKLNNYLRNDRYTPTVYQDELKQLYTENNIYELQDAEKSTMLPSGVPAVDVGKDSIGKDSIGKDSIDICGENEKKPPKPKPNKIHFAEFVTMTNAEYEQLVSTHGKEFADQCITVLDNYKGANGKKYKSDYRAILNWVVDKVKQKNPKLELKRNDIDGLGDENDPNSWAYFMKKMKEKGEK